MAPQVAEFDKMSFNPHVCSCRSPSDFQRRPESPIFTSRLDFRNIRFKSQIHAIGTRGCSGVPTGGLARHFQRLVLAVPRADHSKRTLINEEGKRGTPLYVKASLDADKHKKVSQLRKRIAFGVGIGIAAGGMVFAGRWVFTVALAATIFVGSKEYFELVRSHGIASGVASPPQYVSRACSIIYSLMPILTLYLGNIDVSVTFAAFFLTVALLLQRGNPRFTQLSSTMFGLLYCGYLPSFWVKLRCLAAPSVNTRFVPSWPMFLGGQTMWTVGLVATLMSISCIIAADTLAFFVGKVFGQTPLTAISPKKTWEGTLAGLCGCIATSVLLAKILSWPSSVSSSVAFGFLIFIGSIFGDLTESLMKRDAGVKDSGSLIPGHGGLLDRVDSYVFTGALAYSFVKAFLPLYGV